MALAPFFDRVYGAVGGHLAVTRGTLHDVLASVTAGVSCGANPSINDLWCAEMAVNILARMYPRLAISAEEPHASTLRSLAVKINPSIEFAASAPGATSICVGSAHADGALFPWAAGWVAHLNHSSGEREGATNPYAAAAAAALACAELFRRVFLKGAEDRDTAVSLLKFDDRTGADLSLAEETVGDVAFVGVGAVGNAALWALSRDAALQGRLWLVDPEELSLLNLQRYVLGYCDDVGIAKVSIGKREFAITGLQIEAIQLSLDQFAQERGGLDIHTLVISLDNMEGRRAAQALLPRLIVNGWTGDRALGASWHLFDRNAACLACLYHPRGPGPSATEQAAKALGLSIERASLLWVTRQPLLDADIQTAASTLGVAEAVLDPWRGKPLGDLYTDVVCGAVPLDLSGLGKVETVPLAHQSAMAGILMAAELVKRTQPQLAALSQPEPLVSWDDVLGPPPGIWSKPMAREKGCLCGDPDYQKVYREKWLGAD